MQILREELGLGCSAKALSTTRSTIRFEEKKEKENLPKIAIFWTEIWTRILTQIQAQIRIEEM